MTLYLYNISEEQNELFDEHIKQNNMYQTKNYIIKSFFWGFNKEMKNYRKNCKRFNNINIKEINYLLLIFKEKYYLFRIIGKLANIKEEEKFHHCFILQSSLSELDYSLLEKYKLLNEKKDLLINLTHSHHIKYINIISENIIEKKINQMDSEIHKLKTIIKKVKIENDQNKLKNMELNEIKTKLESQLNFYKNYYDEQEKEKDDDFDFIDIEN